MSRQQGSPGFDPVLDGELADLREAITVDRAALEDLLQALSEQEEKLAELQARIQFLGVLLGQPDGARLARTYFTRYPDGVVREVAEHQVHGLLEVGSQVWAEDSCSTGRRLLDRSWDPRL